MLDCYDFRRSFIFFEGKLRIMDDIDLEILTLLKKNARAKYVKVAESVGLTEGAVRRRVKQLMKQGVIKRFTVETATEFEGIVLVETDPTATKKTTLNIGMIAARVFEVSGDYDIAALIQAYTMDDLNRKIDDIRKLAGVRTTNTLVKLTS
jgi:DNA-binding Lrp family transcriptional regulator